jgi:hypothetical protein
VSPARDLHAARIGQRLANRGEKMESRPLNQAEWLAGVGGFVLVLVMFLFAWFGLPDNTGFDAFDAFDDWINIILVFTAFAGMGLALVGAAGGRTTIGVPLSAVVAGLGILSVVVLIIQIISPPDLSFGGALGGIDLDRKVGIWLGLISAAAIAIGGWMAMQEGSATTGRRTDGA